MERDDHRNTASRNEFYVHDVRVNPDRGLVFLGDGAHRLERKVMAVLVCLSERAGEVVGKDELITRVWGPEGATADLLSRAVGRIRRALASGREGVVLETVRGVGYCLVADVRERPLPISAGSTPSAGGWRLTPAAASALSFAATGIAWLITCRVVGGP